MRDNGRVPIARRSAAFRQMLAIPSDGSRVERLRTMKVPTLVIHGDDEPLVPTAVGKHTAPIIPGAKLEIMPGMGHDLPPGPVERLSRVILDRCQAVGARSRASSAA